MNPRPIAEFLTCFGTEPVTVFHDIECEPNLFAPSETPDEVSCLVEETDLIEIGEGLTSAEAACEYRLEEQRLLFENELTVQKSIWRDEALGFLCDQIKVAIEDVEESLSESVKRILMHFVKKATIEQSVDELCRLVRTLLCDKELRFIEIRAPENLICELRSRLALFQAIKFVESESPEVTVFANQAMVETQFAAWLDRISLLPE